MIYPSLHPDHDYRKCLMDQNFTSKIIFNIYLKLKSQPFESIKTIDANLPYIINSTDAH